MVLAHVSGFSYAEMMNMECRELRYWIRHAFALHKKLNPEQGR